MNQFPGLGVPHVSEVGYKMQAPRVGPGSSYAQVYIRSASSVCVVCVCVYACESFQRNKTVVLQHVRFTCFI